MRGIDATADRSAGIGRISTATRTSPLPSTVYAYVTSVRAVSPLTAVPSTTMRALPASVSVTSTDCTSWVSRSSPAARHSLAKVGPDRKPTPSESVGARQSVRRGPPVSTSSPS
jgi:hypothetical protein